MEKSFFAERNPCPGTRYHFLFPTCLLNDYEPHVDDNSCKSPDLHAVYLMCSFLSFLFDDPKKDALHSIERRHFSFLFLRPILGFFSIMN
ncbi:hypothetical protein CDEST_01495 [Colletotrichum destructivum]|uniref:Uncharacterized protein n=1 Tax=Colletotrichum destructivum TaxID=34406 RepID=A0AAX4I081_9PEZI|nr:hypothetical protein CDEST_01495 [Colletotrichum destructivum]